MEWYFDLAQALEQLANHKLRTLLTLLGMVFGVGAVIAMLSVGEGAEREALRLIDTMGLRNIIVEAKPVPEDMLAEIREDSMGLSLRDLEAARETLPFLSGYTAVKEIRTWAIYNEHGKSDARVIGAHSLADVVRHYTGQSPLPPAEPGEVHVDATGREEEPPS